jgi:hypothetical protein
MIDTGMKPGIISLIVFLPVMAACGGSADQYDCSADSEALNRLCDAFNSGAGPLEFTVSEDFGPSNVRGEISAEGSASAEGLSASGYLTIDIEPQSDKIFLSAMHLELSDFVKGVG